MLWLRAIFGKKIDGYLPSIVFMAKCHYHGIMKSTEKPQPRQSEDKYVVRFPSGMRDRLKDAAAANGRSMNAEIVARLQQSFNIPPSDEALKARLEAAEKTIESHESYEFAIRWVSVIKDSLMGALLKAAEDAGVQGSPVDLARQFLDAQENKDIDGIKGAMDRILGVSAAEKRVSDGASAPDAGEGLSKRELEKIILARAQETARLLRMTTKPLDEQ